MVNPALGGSSSDLFRCRFFPVQTGDLGVGNAVRGLRFGGEIGLAVLSPAELQGSFCRVSSAQLRETPIIPPQAPGITQARSFFTMCITAKASGATINPSAAISMKNITPMTNP